MPRLAALALFVCFASSPVIAQVTDTVDVGRGDVSVYVPTAAVDGTPVPLAVILHGFTGSGAGIEEYWEMEDQAELDGFILAYPDGSQNGLGLRFWNATPACCGIGSGVDDSTYLYDLIAEIRLTYDIDPRRIFVSGHSNGGFMSHRMACDHSDTIAAIASLAGATYPDSTDCEAEYPVHVLQVHGTDDGVISYDGGSILGNAYPSALETVELWAELNGCALETEDGGTLDLDVSLVGDDTTITRYVSDCDTGGSAELWEIDGGAHSPLFGAEWAPSLVEFLIDHPKECDVISSQQQRARLVDAEAATGDALGSAVEVAGLWIFGGAPNDAVGLDEVGSVSVFRREGADWIAAGKLTASDGADGDLFGAALGADVGTLLIGAPGDDDGGSNAGAAYLFVREADGWGEAARVTATDATAGAEFGAAVRIVGDVAVVAAPGDGELVEPPVDE